MGLSTGSPRWKVAPGTLALAHIILDLPSRATPTSSTSWDLTGHPDLPGHPDLSAPHQAPRPPCLLLGAPTSPGALSSPPRAMAGRMTCWGALTVSLRSQTTKGHRPPAVPPLTQSQTPHPPGNDFPYQHRGSGLGGRTRQVSTLQGMRSSPGGRAGRGGSFPEGGQRDRSRAGPMEGRRARPGSVARSPDASKEVGGCPTQETGQRWVGGQGCKGGCGGFGCPVVARSGGHRRARGEVPELGWAGCGACGGRRHGHYTESSKVLGAPGGRGVGVRHGGVGGVGGSLTPPPYSSTDSNRNLVLAARPPRPARTHPRRPAAQVPSCLPLSRRVWTREPGKPT